MVWKGLTGRLTSSSLAIDFECSDLISYFLRSGSSVHETAHLPDGPLVRSISTSGAFGNNSESSSFHTSLLLNLWLTAICFDSESLTELSD